MEKVTSIDNFGNTVNSEDVSGNDDGSGELDLFNKKTIKSEELEKKRLIKLDDDTTFDFQCKVEKEEEEEEKIKLILSEVSAVAPFIYEAELGKDDLISASKIFRSCEDLKEVKAHIEKLFDLDRIKLIPNEEKTMIYFEFNAFNISCEEKFKITSIRKMIDEGNHEKQEEMLLKLYSIQKEKLKILKDIEAYLKTNKNIIKADLEKILEGVK